MAEATAIKVTKDNLISLLKDLCTTYAVDFPTLAAICELESSWKPSATRYEPRFQYLSEYYKYARLNKTDTDFEKKGQMTSWGLGQLMGANFRGLGYSGPLIKENLCEPNFNLNFVCKFFKKTCERYPTLEKKIASYNAGSPQYENGALKNQKYVDVVLGLRDKFS